MLIPGIEKTIEGKHVLIIGLEKIPKINKLRDLKKIHNSALVIAPHPFYPKGHSLRDKFFKHADLFHGIEHCFFYNNLLNFNKKAIKTAKEYNKPLVGTSDVHNLRFFDSTYSLIDSEKNIKSVIDAIKENKLKIITNPISNSSLFFLPVYIILKKIITKK